MYVCMYVTPVLARYERRAIQKYIYLIRNRQGGQRCFNTLLFINLLKRLCDVCLKIQQRPIIYTFNHCGLQNCLKFIQYSL